jgi:hypothetical protein
MLLSAAVLAMLVLANPSVCSRRAKNNGVEKRQVTTGFPPKSWSTKDRYTIMDNDWHSTAMIPFLFALSANMTVLGLTGNTANSWALQSSLHGLALLEHGNLSCIPVALGQYYPITMTEARFDAWTKAWGTLAWDGVFALENLTAESHGSDPTGGDPSRISKSAFIEGYPNTLSSAKVLPSSWSSKYTGTRVKFPYIARALSPTLPPPFA